MLALLSVECVSVPAAAPRLPGLEWLGSAKCSPSHELSAGRANHRSHCLALPHDWRYALSAARNGGAARALASATGR